MEARERQGRRSASGAASDRGEKASGEGATGRESASGRQGETRGRRRVGGRDARKKTTTRGRDARKKTSGRGGKLSRVDLKFAKLGFLSAIPSDLHQWPRNQFAFSLLAPQVLMVFLSLDREKLVDLVEKVAIFSYKLKCRVWYWICEYLNDRCVKAEYLVVAISDRSKYVDRDRQIKGKNQKPILLDPSLCQPNFSSPPPTNVPRRRTSLATTVAVVVHCHRQRRPRLAGSVLPLQRTPPTPRVAPPLREIVVWRRIARACILLAPPFRSSDRPPFPTPRVPSDSAAAPTLSLPLATTTAPRPPNPPPLLDPYSSAAAARAQLLRRRCSLPAPP
ncbi:hypothetical protein Scep_009847 [Stephania cephalantha]|uniref:Uncharacterized protein n=1 Tax=Stephania cephalantha TaxID=152367 RepID=A0AAP0JTW2_9MAGN